MTFLELQQEVARQAGLDQTQTKYSTPLKRWINNSQQLIAQYFEWPFLRSSYPLNIQTVVDITNSTTSSTISTTLASNTFTFSSAMATSVQGYFVQTSSTLDWYRITSHSAGSATFQTDVPALATGSALTFTIRKVFYSLDSTIDRILFIRQNQYPLKMIETTDARFYEYRYYWDTVGQPRAYMVVGKDTSNVWQIKIWPTPDSTMNLVVDYLQKLTDLSADADLTRIPEKWNVCLIEGAKWQAFDFLDDTRASTSKTLFYALIDDMKREYEPSLSQHLVVKAIDEHAEGRIVPFPSNYPYPYAQ